MKKVISLSIDEELLKDIDLLAYKARQSRSAYISGLLWDLFCVLDDGKGGEYE